MKNEKKIDLVVQDNNVKVGCYDLCTGKCKRKISQDRRNFINEEYWQLDPTARKFFMLYYLSKIPIKHRTAPRCDNFRRKQS